MMRAVEFLGESRSELVEKAVPRPAPGFAVVKVLYNAVCGSDLWLYQGNWHGGTYPIVPGHEWSGTVHDVVPADSAWLGRAVTAELATGCGTCRCCRAGAVVMCPDVEEIGFTVDGALAEYVLVPVRNLHELPSGLDPLTACQTEPLAVALHAMCRVGVNAGDRVAVLGCGAIGLLLLQASLAVGANVVLATDPVPYRRDVARHLGAGVVLDPGDSDIDGFDGMADVVLEASGDATSVARAIRIAATLGTVGLVGYQIGQHAELATADWLLKMLTVVGVMGPANFYRPAIDLLARGRVDTSRILSQAEPLSAHPEALPRAVARAAGIRTVFAPSS